LDLPPTKLVSQSLKSVLSLGDHHQPRCFSIETMNQSRLPAALAHVTELWARGYQKIRHAHSLLAAKAVSWHSRGFVDN
jgi:hypothetical protein